MEYLNTKTGNKIIIKGTIKGANWVEVVTEKPKEKSKDTPKKK